MRTNNDITHPADRKTISANTKRLTDLKSRHILAYPVVLIKFDACDKYRNSRLKVKLFINARLFAKDEIAYMKNLIIVDLEATCWETGFSKSFYEMETIEIGAVKIDVEKSIAIDEYDKFIKPIKNPALSEFCTNLTSITQSDVDPADQFPIVFADFLKWIGPLNEMIIASWGNYDFYQFKNDCSLHSVPFPFEKRHINIKDFCKRKLKRRRFGLSFAIQFLEMEFEGTQHRGIDDARNIWRIFEKVSNGNIKAILEDYLTEQTDLFE